MFRLYSSDLPGQGSTSELGFGVEFGLGRCLILSIYCSYWKGPKYLPLNSQQLLNCWAARGRMLTESVSAAGWTFPCFLTDSMLTACVWLRVPSFVLKCSGSAYFERGIAASASHKFVRVEGTHLWHFYRKIEHVHSFTYDIVKKKMSMHMYLGISQYITSKFFVEFNRTFPNWEPMT